DPERILQIVPAHVEYWRKANVKGYMGGPFGDRTGGLISFAAPSLQHATEIILRDPFILEDLNEQMWIKEWFLE
ncbi:MAG TPA: YciI family protein, partial [Anaerolineales bacterium]|nr:YciI family protein [Anaerolineales bacterium]